MKISILNYLLLAAVFMLGSAGLLASDGNGLKIGDVAPDFSLKNVDGNYVSMNDYENAAGFIIIFSCNHCPFVVAVEDRMIALHERYAPMGWHLIAINPNDPAVVPDDSFEKMIERAQEKNFPFPYVKDVGQKVFPQYGATRTPHVFLLDADRVVRYIGAIDDNTRDASAVQEKWLENAMARIMRGMDPDPLETRAIGCTIKVQN